MTRRSSLLLATLCLLGACYPSAAHLTCLDTCHADNDRCVLSAQESTAVQACDETVRQCLAHCPQ